ncbi:MAG: hypothetical protein IJA62_04715 [Ruminococcus sp.]|nr:hypothetical protein [Ruminococcus sp.]
MKRLGKPVAIIFALVILVFSVLSVFGYSYYTGDIKHTVFKGFGSLDWGIDASGGTKIALKPASSEDAQAVADVIRERAAVYGLKEYQLYVDNNNNDVVFVVPKSVDSDYSSSDVASYLTCFGEVSVRPGDSYTNMFVDSSGAAAFSVPKDDTAKTVLLGSRHIRSAGTFEYSDESGNYHYVEIKFNDEGKDILAQLTNADTGTYYNQVMSIWLDDAMLANPTVSESFEQGAFSFSSEHMTADKAKLLSAVISSGTMPCDVSVAGFGEIPPVVGPGVTEVVFWAGIVALLVLSFTLIYKFRAVGVVSVLALIMQFSSVLAILTGFVGEGRTFMMTIPAASAFALCVMLTVLSCTLFARKIKSEVESGTMIDAAVASGFNYARPRMFDLSIVTALISLSGLFIFGASGFAVSLFGTSMASGIRSFCYVLFFGSILNVVTGYLLPQLIIRSLESFKSISKPSMFGGAKK